MTEIYHHSEIDSTHEPSTDIVLELIESNAATVLKALEATRRNVATTGHPELLSEAERIDQAIHFLRKLKEQTSGHDQHLPVETVPALGDIALRESKQSV